MKILRTGLTTDSLLNWKTEVTCERCDAHLEVTLDDVKGEFFDKSLYVMCPCCKERVRLSAPRMVHQHVFPKLNR